MWIPRCENGLGFGKGKPMYGHYYDDFGVRHYGQLGLYVPCGRCPECLRSRQRAWFVRFKYEEMYWRKKGAFRTLFLTLTYDDKNLPSSREAAVKDWQAFLKMLGRKFVYRPRFYVTSENGSLNGRLHFHALLFGVPVTDLDCVEKSVAAMWHRGFTCVQYASGKDFNYVSKYVTKDTDPYRSSSNTSWKTFQSFSKRPSLGFLGSFTPQNVEYLNSSEKNHPHFDGFDYALPRYLASKILTEENRSSRRAVFELKRGLPDCRDPDSLIRREDVYSDYYKKCREAIFKKRKRVSKYDNICNSPVHSGHEA